MSFERPTLSQIIKRVQADAESRMGKKAMRWSLVPVLVRVISGVSHGLHGFIAFVLRQCFTTTAEGAYLERRAISHPCDRARNVDLSYDRTHIICWRHNAITLHLRDAANCSIY